MKKFLFTLAALLSLGFAAQADDIIDFPDEYKNMELTEAQLGTDIQVRMEAHFTSQLNSWRVMFNMEEMPEGLTLKSFSRGNGSWIDYINVDGDEETFKPSLTSSAETGVCLGMCMEQDQDGNILMWTGDHADFVRVTFTVSPDFKGGEIKWAVEPSGGTSPHGSHYDLSATWTVPGGEEPPMEVTATPTIQVQEGDEAYVFTVVGDGELHLYANNVEVENPYTVARGETDVTYYFTATAQEPGKEISETAELTIVVPAKETPVDVPLTGEIVVGEVDPETGLLPVGYNGDEEGVTVTVTVNGVEVEIVDGAVQLAEGDNAVVVTVDGEGYEAMTQTYDVNWTKPVTPPDPEDPHMTGYWLVLIDAEGNLDWEPLIQGVNGDYTQTVALTYEEYGPYVANEDDSNRPWVPFYFVVDGVVYGAETEMAPAVLGNAMQNPLYAESENCYSVLVGFNYTLGIAISPEGDFYVYAAQASPVVGIDELVDGKTVAGVRYFNMAGQEMQEANGMTIVVTTYTDGTTSAVKVMK